MHSMGETSTVTPAFLTKLWALVEDPTTDHLICWDVVSTHSSSVPYHNNGRLPDTTKTQFYLNMYIQL